MPLPQHDLIYIAPDDSAAWQLSKDENVWIKEAIYEGDFELPGGLPLKVTDETINHWVTVTADMLSNGIKIPMPVGHTTDPEKSRGKVIGAYAAKNKAGKSALFLKAMFNDKAVAELNKNTQVSIFSPPEFVDGKGNRYTRPITHVALTDYPVIPALQGFQSIAASFVPNKGEADMPLKKLAGRLNLQCEDDAQLEDTIVASFEGLGTKVTDADKALKAKDEEITALKGKVPKDPITVSASHVSMLKDNRTLKLSNLVGEKISPAVRDGLVDLFCSPTQLTLSLSSEDGDGGLFDKMLDILAKNEVVKLGPSEEEEDTKPLGKDVGNPEKNPLMADVEKRRKAMAS